MSAKTVRILAITMAFMMVVGIFASAILTFF